VRRGLEAYILPSPTMPTASEGGLGSALVGDKIMINARQVLVTKLLGEGTITRGYTNA
jgi:hypothetical protein